MATQLPQGRAESPTGPTPADAAEEIRQFGSAVLRDVWQAEHVARLRSAIVSFCDHRADLIVQGRVDPVMQHYHDTGTTVLTWLIYEGLIEPEFLSSMFRGSFYHGVCRAYFGDDRLYAAPERIGSRNIRPPYSASATLPFHQDSVEQDRSILRVLNCWMPLDEGAGLTAPGVELVRHPGHPIQLRKDNAGAKQVSGYQAVAIDHDWIVAEYGDAFHAPILAPGDGLVFSQDVIHRTHITQQMTRPRIGFEFRVFSLQHLAPRASADEVAARSYPLV